MTEATQRQPRKRVRVRKKSPQGEPESHRNPLVRLPGLQETRIQKNLRQSDLAEKVDLTRTSIARLESGKTRAKMRTLLRLSEALDVEFQKLMLPPDRWEDD